MITVILGNLAPRLASVYHRVPCVRCWFLVVCVNILHKRLFVFYFMKTLSRLEIRHSFRHVLVLIRVYHKGKSQIFARIGLQEITR